MTIVDSVYHHIPEFVEILENLREQFPNVDDVILYAVAVQHYKDKLKCEP